MRAWWLALLLAACGGGSPDGGGGGDDDDDDDDDDVVDTDTTDTTDPAPDMLAVDAYDDQTNASGIVKVKFDVGADVSAVMVTGQSTQWVSLERILDPEGQVVVRWQDWWDSPESLTNAFFGFDKTTAVNWPIRDQDGPLAPGTWTFELSTIDGQGNYAGNTDIGITVHTKKDDDLEQATARVAILWADGVNVPKVVNAVEGAVERWREVWGAAGLDLEVSYLETPLDPKLGFTYRGSDEVASIAADLAPGTLVLVVGETVKNEATTYGVSGGIPGTLAASPMSFVVLAWTSHAGPNGAFDDDEIRLMGEAMAHEMGHYTGLFHPVEESYDLWDALDDTPACTTWGKCDDQLGDNLMYPYPICDFSSCFPQDQLTPDQRAVAHRYTGML